MGHLAWIQTLPFFTFYFLNADELKEQLDDVTQDITTLDEQVTIALFISCQWWKSLSRFYCIRSRKHWYHLPYACTLCVTEFQVCSFSGYIRKQLRYNSHFVVIWCTFGIILRSFWSVTLERVHRETWLYWCIVRKGLVFF